ncbi:SDR family oxidoreductase [Hydrogenimonas sp.]
MECKKVVLVTGASTGMGRATVRFLARQGFRVIAATRSPESFTDLSNGNVTALAFDITDPKSVRSAFEHIDRLDILVNNAGYGLVSTVEDMDETEMLEQFNVNVFGLLRVTKYAIPLMRKGGGGVIINISSFLGKIGLPLLTMYNATKYAVEGVTDSLRYELADFNIRVHSILPGFFDTQFARSNLVTNEKTFSDHSPYAGMVSKLAPQIVEQINHGNDADEVARLIYRIIEDENFPARVTAGEKASKFIPMRKELSDEDFERRVREYYGI